MDAPKRARTWERGGLRGADDIVLVEEPVERQKVAPALDGLTLPPRGCWSRREVCLAGRSRAFHRDHRARRHSTDMRGRAIFGFIQTGSPEEMDAVAIWPPLDSEVLSFSS